MSLWEYKILSSQQLQINSLTILESFLNRLGRDQWEIVSWQTEAGNPLNFQGLARRPTFPEWIPGDPVRKAAAQPKPTEPAAKDKDSPRPEAGQPPPPSPDEGLPADETDEDDEERPPTLLQILRTRLKKNNRGPGRSGSISFLARAFDHDEEDLIEDLKAAGLRPPSDPEEKPVFVEENGELFWLNLNRQGQLWINVRPASPPDNKTIRDEEDPPAAKKPSESRGRSPRETTGEPSVPARRERAAEKTETAPPPAELPSGTPLLEDLRPRMRKNRRAPGLSGSLSFLGKALGCGEETLLEKLLDAGLEAPAKPGEKPAFVSLAGHTWWLNRAQNGQTWLNCRQAKGRDEAPEQPPAPAGKKEEYSNEPPAEPAAKPAATKDDTALLDRILPELKPNRRGSSSSAKLETLAKALDFNPAELEAALAEAGLPAPAEPDDKPPFARHAGQLFWLKRYKTGVLWLNAKPLDTKTESAEDADTD